MLTRKLLATVAVCGLLGVASVAKAEMVEFTFSYDYKGALTDHGTGLLIGTDLGGGAYTLTGGYVNSSQFGHEALWTTTSPLPPESYWVYSNAEGDNCQYDNKLFYPAGGPNGAFLTYIGGIVFANSWKSSDAISFSTEYAGNPGTPYYYWNTWGNNGVLTSFDVKPTPVPEPNTLVGTALGLVAVVGIYLRRRGRA